MTPILITILAISAAWFVISFIVALISDKVQTSLVCGTIVTLILWEPVFVLALIVLILSVVGLVINIFKAID